MERNPPAVAHAFLNALTARDFARLESCLEPGARLRGLYPSREETVEGAPAILERLRGWYAGAADFEVLATACETLCGRVHLAWRFRLRPVPGRDDGAGWHEIEQHAFCDAAERIERIDLLCSGFLPAPVPAVAGETPRRHDFDAGSLGCGSGLPQAFRKRIATVPAGDVLCVTTDDPAAKQDLPALARMLGHRIDKVEALPDGRLRIEVEAKR